MNDGYSYQKLIDDPEDPYYGKASSGWGLINAKTPWHVIRIPFRHFVRVIIALPLGSFAFCVFWALYTNFDKATTVLCAREENRPIHNYLPSLSAAIGDFELSQQIWKLCIILHSPGRFLFATMYLKYLKKVLHVQYSTWATIACLLHVIEIVGLIGLTLISSRHNLFVHAVNFTMFLVCSILYMVLLCILMSKCRQTEATRLESKGLFVKKLLCKIALICAVLLAATYFRHEYFCEEGMYTIFAILEYIFVLSNIGFNGSAYWDFYDRIIILDVFQPCKMPVYRYSWDY